MSDGEAWFHLGGSAAEQSALILLLAGTTALLLGLLSVVLFGSLLLRRRSTDRGADGIRMLEGELRELRGRVETLTDASQQGQTRLARTLTEKLDGVTHSLGQNLSENSRRTSESLNRLGERLAVIDHAQERITDLSSNLSTLQQILSDKQRRGAFGQGRLEAIVKDALPPTAYSFQPTLSNGTRPDCLIHIPDAADLVIDAKFPLENLEALREARSEEERKAAGHKVRQDVTRHIADIAGKYLVAGETQDQALLFVPSESTYLDLYESFPDLISRASRSRILIVSPSLLMLAVQTLMGILKDVQMREHAVLLQKEVSRILEEVRELMRRTEGLQRSARKWHDELDAVDAVARRIADRGARIERLDWAEETDPEDRDS